VLLIAAVGWVMLRQVDWFKHPAFSGYLLMVSAGLLLAVLVEWTGLRVLGRWQYTKEMPMVPGLNVGLVPIAQMLILPPLVFRIVAVFGARNAP
jgi:hypothetical protein